MPVTITKADLIDAVVSRNGYTSKQGQEMLEALIGIIKSSLESGDDVLVSGFGKFCVREKVARRGRNPATGQSMTLPARRVVVFRCSGKLRERINGR